MKNKVKTGYKKKNQLKTEKSKSMNSIIKLLIANSSSPPKMTAQLTSIFPYSVIVI